MLFGIGLLIGKIAVVVARVAVVTGVTDKIAVVVGVVAVV